MQKWIGLESIDVEYGYSCWEYHNIRSSNKSCKNIGANEHGKLKACADCKIVSDMLKLDRIKASQFALDGGVIISKIMKIKRECKIEFEH